jgi:hypothetical protein
MVTITVIGPAMKFVDYILCGYFAKEHDSTDLGIQKKWE